MMIYIILLISLAAKCSSMPPTYPNITKPVRTSYSQKFNGKGNQGSVTFKSEPMSTTSPCSDILDSNEIDPFSSEGVQYAPLPFKLKDKKMMRLCTKVSTGKATVAFEYEGGEEVDGSTEPPRKPKVEPSVSNYRGPKVYSQFIPGHNIRAYPYWHNNDVADAKLAEENEKLESMFRHYINYENEWKSKHVAKLAMFNVPTVYTPNDERFEMEIIADTTSQAPPHRRVTRPKLRRLVHLNFRDFKSNRVSHVAPAAGLLRMVAHPVGNFKLGKKELALLRNKYFGRT